MSGGGTHTGWRASGFAGVIDNGKSLTLSEKVTPTWDSTAKQLKKNKEKDTTSSIRELPNWDEND